eukprot:1159892-Pelagomonas_calceolata.AAC.15
MPEPRSKQEPLSMQKEDHSRGNQELQSIRKENHSAGRGDALTTVLTSTPASSTPPQQPKKCHSPAVAGVLHDRVVFGQQAIRR